MGNSLSERITLVVLWLADSIATAADPHVTKSFLRKKPFLRRKQKEQEQKSGILSKSKFLL